MYGTREEKPFNPYKEQAVVRKKTGFGREEKFIYWFFFLSFKNLFTAYYLIKKKKRITENINN